MGLKAILALVLIMYASFGFAMAPSTELTQNELTNLTDKQLVVHSREIPKCPWPEITVFTLIDAAPVEAAAVFSNYQDHKTFIPDLIKSDPARKLADNETIVDFEMRLPWPLSSSKYSTGNVFNRLEKNEYEVRWYLAGSDSLVDSKGTVQFTPYGSKTLLKYQSLIRPDSKLASVFASRAKGAVSKTVQAIVTYVEETKKKDPEKVERLISCLPK